MADHLFASGDFDDDATNSGPAVQGDIADGGEDEQKQILQHFLLSSPPGQIDEINSDLTVIAPPGLSKEDQLAIYRFYNMTNLQLVELEQTNMVICEAGQVAENHYLDAVSGDVVEVDHLKKKRVETTGTVPPPPPELLGQGTTLGTCREALQAALSAYIQEYYSASAGARAGVGVYLSQTPGGLEVVLSAERLNLRNFWSGSWQGRYTVTAPPAGQGALTGVVKLRGHYFDDGNVQLQTTKSMEPVALTTPQSAESAESVAVFAQSVVDAIKSSEQELQQGLEAMYLSMSDETLKSMRRILPRTRQKMDWNLQHHRMVRNMRK
mmetsp:Transcript_23328/g.33914  ORF Transcript_23328/g.33914 Transcript_23328/m.33914 type:complete len:324 (-) Transcript_23328:173-1144(-)